MTFHGIVTSLQALFSNRKSSKRTAARPAFLALLGRIDDVRRQKRRPVSAPMPVCPQHERCLLLSPARAAKFFPLWFFERSAIPASGPPLPNESMAKNLQDIVFMKLFALSFLRVSLACQ